MKVLLIVREKGRKNDNIILQMRNNLVFFGKTRAVRVGKRAENHLLHDICAIARNCWRNYVQCERQVRDKGDGRQDQFGERTVKGQHQDQHKILLRQAHTGDGQPVGLQPAQDPAASRNLLMLHSDTSGFSIFFASC
jgi:hypothetical protein